MRQFFTFAKAFDAQTITRKMANFILFECIWFQRLWQIVYYVLNRYDLDLLSNDTDRFREAIEFYLYLFREIQIICFRFYLLRHTRWQKSRISITHAAEYITGYYERMSTKLFRTKTSNNYTDLVELWIEFFTHDMPKSLPMIIKEDFIWTCFIAENDDKHILLLLLKQCHTEFWLRYYWILYEDVARDRLKIESIANLFQIDI